MKKNSSSYEHKDRDKIDLVETSLGIELGSTRIKAVLIDKNYIPIASGEFEWNSEYKNNIWTYDLEKVWNGVQIAFKELSTAFEKKYSIPLQTIGSIGISGMMHGYLPFDTNDKQLVPFRTWKNTITEKSSKILSALFQFNIPQRWSVSHLYQAILNNEKHLKKIKFMTTLPGYVHWKLTGKKILGVGEASGMFPIDNNTLDWDKDMMSQFNNLIKDSNYNINIKNILPEVKIAGEKGGNLTKEGAKLLDPDGILEGGIPFCPPEGDAGTGMVATNSVKSNTGNVSAGTSIFSMVVLEKKLSNYYVEIDIVMTPDGKPVAMVHGNNFTKDINDWISLFKEVIESLNIDITTNELFTHLFKSSLNADMDVGKIFSINYFTGEPITDFEKGLPLLVRMPDSDLNMANFIRSLIYSSLATLKIGIDLLIENENIQVDYLFGHGGFFKTEYVGQQIMADALNTPISLMKTAGDGGPWGMALLAAYSKRKESDVSLEDFLEDKVYSHQHDNTVEPQIDGVKSYNNYIKKYKKALLIERTAIENLL